MTAVAASLTSGWGARDFMRPGRSMAVGDRGVAAASHPAVAMAAVGILRDGGNAVDAAICAVALQSVIDPQMTSLGGDCFAIVARPGEPQVAINGSGRSSSLAALDWFLERGMSAIPDLSPLSITVPGAVAAWVALSERHGRLSLDRLLQPAIRAAKDGYVVTPRMAVDWRRYSDRLRDDAAAAAALLPGGSAPPTGARMGNLPLAGTLERIARDGHDGFYRGETAEDIAEAVTAAGGLMTPDDLASERADFVEPIAAAYRGWRLVECPPNGQGLAALLIARILEGFDLQGSAMSEADRVHLLAEATKAAYAVRDRIIADPAHAAIDAAGALSDASVAALRDSIDIARAAPPIPDAAPAHRDTVTVAVADGEGCAVSIINSVFHAFGAGVMAPRSGVLLQNRGAGFSLKPGHPNAIAPRKRPFHTIIPAVAVAPGGAATVAFGVMGGPYQAAGHAQILTGLADRGLDLQAACDAPRSFAHDGLLDLETMISRHIEEDLRARGHAVRRADEPIGGCQAVCVDHVAGLVWGASDHRKDGVALAAA
jgi:gamma-glutamyltranspeptidase/glutathione hydrolase